MYVDMIHNAMVENMATNIHHAYKIIALYHNTGKSKTQSYTVIFADMHVPQLGHAV